MDRITRIFRLIMLLQGQPMTAVELMADMGISRRTLFRDLKILEQAGVPYYHEAGVGYRIGERFFLPPVSLTVPETLGLMLLAKKASASKAGPLGRASLTAIGKLSATVPAGIREACAQMLANVSIDPGAQLDSDQESAFYLQIQQCIDEGRCMRVKYQSPMEAGALEMRLEPYALHFAARAWYVMGYCDHFGEVRTLKLSRIVSMQLLSRLFVKPRNFNLMDRIGQAWQLIPEGMIHQVELHFSPRVARNVIETRWHASQRHRLLEDGSCIVTFEVDGLGEIMWWICGYADQVRVLKPDVLARRVCKRMSAAASQYDEPLEQASPRSGPDEPDAASRIMDTQTDLEQV